MIRRFSATIAAVFSLDFEVVPRAERTASLGTPLSQNDSGLLATLVPLGSRDLLCVSSRQRHQLEVIQSEHVPRQGGRIGTDDFDGH